MEAGSLDPAKYMVDARSAVLLQLVALQDANHRIVPAETPG
jgi:hypothetical protein